MKKHNLLLPALAAGAGGFALRLLLYRTGFDDRGLLNPADPLHILCWLLAAALAGFLLLRLRRDSDPHMALPPWLTVCAAIAAASLLALRAWTLTQQAQTTLHWVRAALCALTAAAAALDALAETGRKHIHPSFFMPACLFFALDMLCRYQSWSGNPQLADYSFALAASVFLCLSAYQRLALPARLGNRRAFLLYTLMALSLCLYSLAGSQDPVFYLGSALWALAGLRTSPKKENGHASA